MPLTASHWGARKVWLMALAALVPWSAAFGAPSDKPEIEQIVVTGDFRERSLHSLAASASAIGHKQIRQRSAKHLEDILALAPNVNFAKGSSRARFYQIRGVGERSQYEQPANSSVGLLIDDVDFSAAGTTGTLFDVEQAEVLRGPQGTRYGAGAMAGLINLKTKNPTTRYEGYVEQEVGSNGLVSTGIAHGGPVIAGRLLYRIAAQQHQSRGFINNNHLNSKKTNNQDELTLRGKLRWFVFDALTLDMQLGHINVDNGYDAFSLENTRATLSDEPGRDAQKSSQGGFRLVWDSDRSKLNIIANISDSNIDYRYDEDWVFDGFHPDGYNSTDRYQRDRLTRSLEVRLVSTPAGSLWHGRMDWLAGLYVLDKRVRLTRIYTFNSSDFKSDYGTEQYAFYGELDSRLREDLTLSTGFRVESWSADYSDSAALAFNPKETLWGGRVVLAFQPTTEFLLYASVSRGYKSGSFNTDGTLPADLREYGSETLYNFEIGAKRTWWEERLSARATVFYMDRKDIQISSSITRMRAGSGSGEFITLITNAAGGTNQGFELEFTLQATNRWLLNGSLGVLATKYQGFTNATGENFSGRAQAHAPEWQYWTSIEHRFTPTLYLRLEAQGRAAFFFSDSHNNRSTQAHLLHARLGYETQRWDFAIWSRNLTNENVQSRGFFFGNDPRTDYADRSYTQLDEPRVYGATLQVHF